ncbi:reverse transcriptase domain-containing protein [Tanacetum coccineum]
MPAIRRTRQRFNKLSKCVPSIDVRLSYNPWLRCVGPIQADYVLREIHAGSCSMHSGPRSVVARALRSGTSPFTSPCQFPTTSWVSTIAGPFPVAAGGLKFLIVAIDYFTKWIEAKAVATITGNQGYYDAKVRGVSFRPGDFVYRANDASHAEDTGKLGPKWEGPYEVTEALGKGHTKTGETLYGQSEFAPTWNICNLKKCYL